MNMPRSLKTGAFFISFMLLNVWFYLLLLRKPCPAFEVRPQRRDGVKRRREKENVVLLKHAFLSSFYSFSPAQGGGSRSAGQVKLV